MKIVVAIKQVPARDSQLRIREDGQWILEDDLSFEINEPDAYALEEGLQLKEKHGGEVMALCLGPLARVLRFARRSRKAPIAPSISRKRALPRWTLSASRGCLRKRFNRKSPDLILTGLQSDDLGYGQTGVVLAELLGWTHSTIIMQVEVKGNRFASSANWKVDGSSTSRCRYRLS